MRDHDPGETTASRGRTGDPGDAGDTVMLPGPIRRGQAEDPAEIAPPTGDTIAAHRRQRRRGDQAPDHRPAADNRATRTAAEGQRLGAARVPRRGLIDTYPPHSAAPITGTRAPVRPSASRAHVDADVIERAGRARARRRLFGLVIALIGVVVLGLALLVLAITVFAG